MDFSLLKQINGHVYNAYVIKRGQFVIVNPTLMAADVLAKWVSNSNSDRLSMSMDFYFVMLQRRKYLVKPFQVMPLLYLVDSIHLGADTYFMRETFYETVS